MPLTKKQKMKYISNHIDEMNEVACRAISNIITCGDNEDAFMACNATDGIFIDLAKVQVGTIDSIHAFVSYKVRNASLAPPPDT